MFGASDVRTVVRPPSSAAAALTVVIALCLAGLGDTQPASLPPPSLEISPQYLSEESMRERVPKEVNLTLVGSDWAPELGVDLDATADWLARVVGVISREQERGWSASVAPYLSPAHVVRTTSTMLTLRLLGIDGTGWYPAFDVRETEAVAVGAPWWATAANLTAVPPYANFSFVASTPRVTVLGDLIGRSVRVADLAARSHTMLFVLSGGEWHLDAGRPGHAAYLALSRALVGPAEVGLEAGTSGWQLAASGLLRATRLNATHLELTVPPLPAYRIDSPEEVEVTVPASAVLNHHVELRGLGSFTVRATAGRATLRCAVCG